MTAALDLPPTPGHPAVVVEAVHEVLNGLERAVPLELGEYAGAVRECERAIRRLEAVKLGLVAAADAAQAGRLAGHSSTGTWLASQTRNGSARSARETRLATDLDQSLPATSAALDRGTVSVEHAAVIAHTIRSLPAGLDSDQVTRIEARLAVRATRLDPQRLRRVARRALEAVQPDPTVTDAHEDDLLRDEEQAALAGARLTLHDNDDGTTTGRFTVPTLAATMLRKVLDAMTAPRRAAIGSTPGVSRDPAHARGLAFADLLGHLPTDHLHTRSTATVVVTLSLDTLRGQLKAAGLDTGDLVSAGEARRLACTAGIVPAVLDGQSRPLDLGRSKRLFSQTQALALGLHHTTCAAHGCERPFAWCELHHLQAWSRDGRTDLGNAVPLCGFHHRRVHDRGYLHRRWPDGSLHFHART